MLGSLVRLEKIMSYKSETIQAILPRINETFFLPAMQREFIWSAEDICDLFDSLMRRFPISTFLLWQIPRSEGNQIEAYKFLKTVHAVDNRSQPTELPRGRDIMLVLDGQQRLTALLVGLSGTYREKKGGGGAGNNQIVDKDLRLNLLHDGEVRDDDGKLEYEFRFWPRQHMTIAKHQLWFRVKNILEIETNIEDFIAMQIEYHDKNMERPLRQGEKEVIRRNLTRLYEAVSSDQTISYHVEAGDDPARVLEIFVRANDGGVKLSKSDLLLSTLTLHWRDGNPKELINDFVADLNRILSPGERVASRKNRLTKDFVMKSCIVLNDTSVAYDVNTFNKATCMDICRNWKEFSSAIQRAVEAAAAFGLRGRSLTSANALIPIAWYLYQRGPRVTLLEESREEDGNARRARLWLISALINHILSGSSDGMLAALRLAIGHGRRDFPTLSEMDEKVRLAHRTATSDEQTIKNILNINYEDETAFLAVSLLYDDRHWSRDSIDHIFSQKELKDTGRPDAQRVVNDIGNLALITSRENSEKSDRSLRDWRATRDPEFLKRHLIPDDTRLWHVDRYDQFLLARRRLIWNRMEELFLVRGREGQLATSAESPFDLRMPGD